MSIAIIGMSCLFPGAKDLSSYWENIINKENCITDIPKTHWSLDDHYDHDIQVQDKTYCKKGGFIPDIEFDPLEFGIPPSQLETIDIAQLLSLIVAQNALLDAGLIGEGAKPFNRRKTGVILGSAGNSHTLQHYCARMERPALEKVLEGADLPEQERRTIIQRYKSSFIDWQESSFPGLLNNIISGRICNRFDLGGTNFTVDAACASSLGALKMAVFELESGNCDIMISGGVNEGNSVLTFICFSKTPVLSFRNECRPFDCSADGTILGEGAGMVVLKRLKDALRDKDRIYAVIKGIGSSSDGCSTSIYAPRTEGQVAAMERAYEKAKIRPEDISLIEAHATGTVAGDLAEMNSLNIFFGSKPVSRQSIALGSVKSQIGHTTSAAGAASLIKVALALYHKTLPPTINVEMPKDTLHLNESSPFYLNTETRPWLAKAGAIRRAGVNSFGFGGTNYHLIIEEYEPPKHVKQKIIDRVDAVPRPFVLYADSREGLKQKVVKKLKEIQSGHEKALYAEDKLKMEVPAQAHRLGFIADSPMGACRSLEQCLQLLDNKEDSVWRVKDIYYRDSGINTLSRKTVALFPGQGSQYLTMASGICRNYETFRKAVGCMDVVMQEQLGRPISSLIYPVPVFTKQAKDAQKKQLTETRYAQPALGAVSMGYFNLFKEAGLKVDYAAGHSYGELTALWAAGVLNDKDFCRLSVERGKAMQPRDAEADPGSMLAVYADHDTVQQYINSHKSLAIANLNAPRQVVVAGPSEDIVGFREWLAQERVRSTLLPVASAFHTKMVAHAHQSFCRGIERVSFGTPIIPVFSNITAQAYPTSPALIQNILSQHIISPVQFQRQIETLYAEGGYVFIEFGPRAVLTNLIKQILDKKPYYAITVNPGNDEDDERQLMEALLQAKVLGICDGLFQQYGIRLRYGIQSKAQQPGLSIKLNGGMYLSDSTRRRINEAVKLQPVRQRTEVHQDTQMTEKPMDKQQIASMGGSSDRLDSHKLLSALKSVNLVHEHYLNNYGDFIKLLDAGLKKSEGPRGNEDGDGRATAIISKAQEIQLQNSKIHAQFLDQHLAMTRLLVGRQAQSLSAQSPGIQIGNQKNELTGEPIDAKSAKSVSPSVEKCGPCASEEIFAQLVEIISEKAGYPAAVLERNTDIEADLGLDPIQRVEIMSALREKFPEARVPSTEDLSGLRTISDILAFITSQPVLLGGKSDLRSAPQESSGIESSEAIPSRGVIIEEEILNQLMAIIHEKTGYPIAILKPEMDIENDLGIDSIKRVEIMSAVREKFPQGEDPSLEELAELKTISDITEYVKRKICGFQSGLSGEVQPPEVEGEFRKKAGEIDSQPGEGEGENARQVRGQDEYEEQSKENRGKSGRPLERFRVDAHYLPLPDKLIFHHDNNDVCLITHDGSSLSLKLAHGLQKMGCRPVVITLPAHPLPFKNNTKAKIPLIALEEIGEQYLKEILHHITTRYGQVRTFIHLHPQRIVNGIQDSLDLQDLDLVKSVFFLAKALHPALVEGSRSQKRTTFMCVTRLDGRLGTGGRKKFSAVSGGLFGLVKSLKRELPELFCRCLDIAPKINVSKASSLILMELQDPDQNLIEIGYSGEKERLTLKTVPEPVDQLRDVSPVIDKKGVFLVTGGGKGITSRCILEMAHKYQGTYLLLGRTSLKEIEPEWTKNCFDEKEMKNRIYDHLKGNSETITPRQVNSMHKKIRAQRKIWQTIRQIEERGGRAVYVSVDICQKNDLTDCLQEVINRFGPITGLIHGAGNLADKKIEKKTEKDFESVIGPKLLGLKNILSVIDLKKLQQVILFSSVVGFWGNAGQTDYSLANEVLNKLAHVWRTCRPQVNVQSINWGPWEDGMVTPELKKAYEERHIQIIPVQDGARAFVQEMEYGKSPQIIIGSELRHRPQRPPSMFIANILQRVVKIEDNPFLLDHVIGGRPVLPAMCGLSWMISSCERLFPGFRFARAESFKVLKGIAFENGIPGTFFLEITPQINNGHTKDQICCEAVIYQHRESHLGKQLNFQAKIVIAREDTAISNIYLPTPMSISDQMSLLASGRADVSVIANDFYRNKTLFHGPLFQGLKQFTTLKDESMITDNQLPSIPLPNQGQFIFSSFNPYTADVQLHGCLILFHRLTGKFGLPDGFEQLIQFQQVPFDTPYKTKIQPVSRNKDRYLVDCETYTQEGELLMHIKSLSCTLSDGLTKLWQQNLYHPMARES